MDFTSLFSQFYLIDSNSGNSNSPQNRNKFPFSSVTPLGCHPISSSGCLINNSWHYFKFFSLDHSQQCNTSPQQNWVHWTWKMIKNSHTWQPAFSNIFAYSTVFSKSSKTRILQVTGIISFSFSKLTVNKTKLYNMIMNREVI